MKSSHKKAIKSSIIAAILIISTLYLIQHQTSFINTTPFEVTVKTNGWYHYSNDIFSFDYPNRLADDFNIDHLESSESTGLLTDRLNNISYSIHKSPYPMQPPPLKKSYVELFEYQNYTSPKTIDYYSFLTDSIKSVHPNLSDSTLHALLASKEVFVKEMFSSPAIIDYNDFLRDSIEKLHPNLSIKTIDFLLRNKNQTFILSNIANSDKNHYRLENISILGNDTISTSINIFRTQLNELFNTINEIDTVGNFYRRIYSDLDHNEYSCYSYWGHFTITEQNTLSRKDIMQVLKSIRIKNAPDGYKFP